MEADFSTISEFCLLHVYSTLNKTLNMGDLLKEQILNRMIIMIATVAHLPRNNRIMMTLGIEEMIHNMTHVVLHHRLLLVTAIKAARPKHPDLTMTIHANLRIRIELTSLKIT